MTRPARVCGVTVQVASKERPVTCNCGSGVEPLATTTTSDGVTWTRCNSDKCRRWMPGRNP